MNNEAILFLYVSTIAYVERTILPNLNTLVEATLSPAQAQFKVKRPFSLSTSSTWSLIIVNYKLE